MKHILDLTVLHAPPYLRWFIIWTLSLWQCCLRLLHWSWLSRRLGLHRLFGRYCLFFTVLFWTVIWTSFFWWCWLWLFYWRWLSRLLSRNCYFTVIVWTIFTARTLFLLFSPLNSWSLGGFLGWRLVTITGGFLPRWFLGFWCCWSAKKSRLTADWKNIWTIFTS